MECGAREGSKSRPRPLGPSHEAVLDITLLRCQSRRVKSCGPSGSQDLALFAELVGRLACLRSDANPWQAAEHQRRVESSPRLKASVRGQRPVRPVDPPRSFRAARPARAVRSRQPPVHPPLRLRLQVKAASVSSRKAAASAQAKNRIIRSDTNAWCHNPTRARTTITAATSSTTTRAATTRTPVVAIIADTVGVEPPGAAQQPVDMRGERASQPDRLSREARQRGRAAPHLRLSVSSDTSSLNRASRDGAAKPRPYIRSVCRELPGLLAANQGTHIGVALVGASSA